MGADDREQEVRSVVVPAELVRVLLDSVMHTMWQWHEDNEFDLDPMVCSAAIMVTAKMFNEHTMSFPEGGGMLQ